MDLALVLSVSAISISVFSLIISTLSFLNARKSRLDGKAEALFVLRLNTLKAAKEVESLWLEVSNDLYHAINRLSALGVPATSISDFEGMRNDVREFVDDARDIRVRIEQNFEAFTEESAKLGMRTLEVAKISLPQCRAELGRKIANLEQHIANIVARSS